MVIAAIATFHVIISHYAVGGGLFLAVETSHARKSGDAAYLAYLRGHARFFILITMVLGAITGVGIWWTIGLASPLATEVLIRIFVFGWAMEYVFFLLEIVSAFLFYYLWDRLTARTHVMFAWIYAFSAWMSLVLITGITAFMLNSGDWVEEGGFWRAFFNPQFLPQTAARTGGALLLASMTVYFHASIWAPDAALRLKIARRSARPALLGAVLIALGTAGWYANLPAHSLVALAKAPALNIFMALLFAITVAAFAVFFLIPYRHPNWLSPGFGILFLMFGIGAVAMGEFVREAVRKPFIVDRVVLSNQVLVSEMEATRRDGLLERGPWTRAWVRGKYPEVFDGPRIDESRLLALPRPDQIEIGALVFMHACNDCHAIESGLSAMRHLTQSWPDDRLRSLARSPETFQHIMPPFAGTDEESEMLALWLIANRPEPLAIDTGLREGN
jgi:cytochrome bd-type quinol oxidase subunit 1